MNGQDKQNLNVILERMDQADKDRISMHADIKFIKENLFNPKTGLWTDVNRNTDFRINTGKWRGIVGAGFIGLVFKQLYDLVN